MPKQKHIHKYKKVILGKDYLVFKCQLPECSHYVPARLAEGKLSLCNRCGNAMLLDKRAMKLKLPHCTDCIQPRKKEEYDAIKDFLIASESGKAS